LFSASLETELTRPTPEQLTALLNNWPALLRRTRQLGYNKKLEVYAATQADLRAIFAISEQEQRPSAWQPLDLEVVMVRPKWLCGTFAFHPMLGFRRANQAASIAHGCASTLARLGELRQAGRTMASLLETLVTFMGVMLILALAAQSVQEIIKIVFAIKSQTALRAVRGVVVEAAKASKLLESDGEAIFRSVFARLQGLGQNGV